MVQLVLEQLPQWGKTKDVIYINKRKDVQCVTKNIIHQGLEDGWYISQSEWHHQELLLATRSVEYSLLPWFVWDGWHWKRLRLVKIQAPWRSSNSDKILHCDAVQSSVNNIGWSDLSFFSTKQNNSASQRRGWTLFPLPGPLGWIHACLSIQGLRENVTIPWVAPVVGGDWQHSHVDNIKAGTWFEPYWIPPADRVKLLAPWISLRTRERLERHRRWGEHRRRSADFTPLFNFPWHSINMQIAQLWVTQSKRVLRTMNN